jgi:hypothetical protein
VQLIQRLDEFDGISTPVFRFKAKFQGLCHGEFFGRFLVDLHERFKMNANIERVDEIQSIQDLDTVNAAMGFGRYGKCSRLGVGYGQTKSAFGISPRELMFLYGLQEFPDGSFLIWGTKLEKYDHLLPAGRRHTRAKSHLFAVTLQPTGKDAFDVEYALQFEVGGRVPNFLTTPLLIDTVKGLFERAQKECARDTDTRGLDTRGRRALRTTTRLGTLGKRARQTATRLGTRTGFIRQTATRLSTLRRRARRNATRLGTRTGFIRWTTRELDTLGRRARWTLQHLIEENVREGNWFNWQSILVPVSLLRSVRASVKFA